MAVTLRIPTALRKLSGGEETLSLEAGSVRELVEKLAAQHPELSAQLVDESGKVRRFVNIFANDEDIRFLEGLDTTLGEGDEVSIVPAIAGGR